MGVAGFRAVRAISPSYNKAMTTPLLTTKLLVPQPRPGLVGRPRLLAKLDEGAQRALTLVCAPAGYGKTTLLAEWAARQLAGTDAGGPGVLAAPRPNFCWVDLDQADNCPDCFLSYLEASLSGLPWASGMPWAEMAEAVPPPPLEVIFTALINDLHQLGLPVTLVLDDYQCVSEPAIHEGLAFLVDHLPPNGHLVVVTREDPPLALARLRARGQLVEVRADDLRFSLDEAEAMLNQVNRLELGSQDVARLEQRTEGWVAGLQMAALALKSVAETRPADTAAYVAGFSGTNRYILDYLAEEVLRHQPPATQAFLYETSILLTLSGPLCDAVIGIDGCATDGARPPSQQMLEELERANLFLRPLDSERRWYRYHQLFGDLLRARLEQQQPVRVAELYAPPPGTRARACWPRPLPRRWPRPTRPLPPTCWSGWC